MLYRKECQYVCIIVSAQYASLGAMRCCDLDDATALTS